MDESANGNGRISTHTGRASDLFRARGPDFLLPRNVGTFFRAWRLAVRQDPALILSIHGFMVPFGQDKPEILSNPGSMMPFGQDRPGILSDPGFDSLSFLVDVNLC